jgi:iron complex outermembrane receptor protein
MRVAVIASAICLCLFGLTTAGEVKASVRKDTNIPAGGLGPALQTLAKQYGFQVLYRTEVVGQLPTAGAVGEFTPEEALKQLLRGTGLTYRYLDEKTITIVAPSNSGTSYGAPTSVNAQPSAANGQKEALNSSAQSFLLAQATVGQATGDAASANGSELQEIVVTSHYEFLSADTSGTTNLPLPIEQVPQTISLVSNDFIKAVNLKTLGEIAEYTPGALNEGNPEGLQSIIYLRGFQAYRATDGIPQQQSFFEPDYAIYDRLEIVQGPTSVVYGVLPPGGLVNFVTKSATSLTPTYLYAQVGSWNSFRIEGQASGALDSEGRVRAIGVAVQDQGDSFTHSFYHKETSIYGGLDFNLASNITGYVHGGWERFERPSFDGIPTFQDGSMPPVPRSFFVGSPDIVQINSVYHAESALTWHATKLLDVDLKANFQDASLYGGQSYSYVLQSNGDLGLAYNQVRDAIKASGVGLSALYHLDSLNLVGSFVSVAALYTHGSTNYESLAPSVAGAGNIFQGQDALINQFNALAAQPLTVPFNYSTTQNLLTISQQSWLELTRKSSALIGVSYSKAANTEGGAFASNGTEQSTSFPGHVSWRGGLTYELAPKTFAYLSYSQSFVPQSPQLQPDGSHALPKPLTGEQYEGGLKYRSPEGRLLLTGALYEIRQRNLLELASFDPITGAQFYQPLGEQTNKGVSLQALGRIGNGWELNAGYAYLDPRITAASPFTQATVGQTQLFLPKNTANVYTTYTLQSGALRGLFFGGGVRYVDSQKTSFDTAANPTRDIPGYVLLDLSAGYSAGKWLVQLNAHNVTDKFYYINNYQSLFYGNMIGAPFNVALTVRRAL